MRNADCGFTIALLGQYDEAGRRGIAVGELIAELLTSALGSTPAPDAPAKRSLADLAGTWTHEEAEVFLAALTDFEQIDQDMWQ